MQIFWRFIFPTEKKLFQAQTIRAEINAKFMNK